MSKRAIKKWLYDRLVASANAAPGTYPQDACAGVLNAAGFTPAKIALYLDRPAKVIMLLNRPTIGITVTNEEEEQLTTGGPYGTVKNTVSLLVDLGFVADFTGDPATTTAPTYTSEQAAEEYFDKFTNAVKRSIRLSVANRTAPNVYAGRRWQATDPQTGEQSWVEAKKPGLTTRYSDKQLPGNSKNILYIAELEFDLTETLQDVTGS